MEFYVSTACLFNCLPTPRNRRLEPVLECVAVETEG